MTTTASAIRSDTGSSLFYFAKITGLPFYFFSVINPTSSAYGAGAWTLPTGYSAVPGMDLPDDSIDQKMSDMIGGIASAERIRLSLLDFKATDSNGTYNYLASLFFSPGRLASLGAIPELASSILVTDGGGSTFDVIGATSAYAAGNVHVGSECVAIASCTTPDTAGRATLTIASSGRNLYPCATGYPPIPFHRASYAEGAAGVAMLGRNQRVTTEPISMIGRTAALYIGHMQPNGIPCLESETLCRFIGRLTSFDTGKAGGMFEVSMESIISDLSTAQVAQGLAVSELESSIVLAQDEYRSFEISWASEWDTDHGSARSAKQITVPSGIYDTIDDVCREINKQLLIATVADLAWQAHMPSASVETFDGVRKVCFRGPMYVTDPTGAYGPDARYEIRVSNCVGVVTRASGFVDIGRDLGLLTALGFEGGDVYVSQIDPSRAWTNSSGTLLNGPPLLMANRPAAVVFCPLGRDKGSVGHLTLKDKNAPFFSDQGDGSGVAYCRFSNGAIVRVVKGTDYALPVGTFFPTTRAPADLYGNDVAELGPQARYLYAESGESSTFEQVVLSPPLESVDGSPGAILGRLLASTGTGVGSGNLDCYPQGVGLALNAILDTTSILRLGRGADIKRACVIDSKTKFLDLFGPLAKEYGWFLVWDPSQGKIAMRSVTIPSLPAAASPNLSDSNRTSPNDRTEQKIDQTAICSAWTLKWGYSRPLAKFTAPDLTINDLAVASAYGASTKPQTIEDKTIVGNSAITASIVAGKMLERSYLYRQPWLRCRRTMNKAGLLMAPGSVHKIVDATMFNPFARGVLGVTDADNLYGLITSVSGNPATGACRIEFIVNRQDHADRFRAISPAGLLDYNASGHGYNNATGVVTFANRFASDGASYDGIDFVIGDKVALISYDSDQDPTYYHRTTISAVASDGLTVTVASGLGAIGTEEVLMILDVWQTPQTTTRKNTIAFEGDIAGLIDSTTQNNRWA